MRGIATVQEDGHKIYIVVMHFNFIRLYISSFDLLFVMSPLVGNGTPGR